LTSRTVVSTILYVLILVLLFFLVTVPSLIYGISSFILTPVGWLIRLFIGRPIFSYKAGVIALKMSTVFLLIIVPTILYFYVWEPLGWIFFSWIALYFLIRIYSGVHERERTIINAWKEFDVFINKYRRTYTKYNLPIAFITIILTIASPALGYFIGGNAGLLTGIVIAIIIWVLSPFARETIIEK